MSAEPETNWDTDEMIRWIANTETLYLACQDQDGWAIKNFMIGYLSSGPPDGFDVDMDKVDWDEVARNE